MFLGYFKLSDYAKVFFEISKKKENFQVLIDSKQKFEFKTNDWQSGRVNNQ